MTDAVVVAGAAGFIGRHVCRELARQGLHVLGIGRGSWSAGERRAWGVAEWLEADIGPDTLGQLAGARTPRAVIHCAGSGSVAFAQAAPFEDFQKTVVSTAAVLEFARTQPQAGCRVVIASSAAVYGDQGDIDLAETSSRSPISAYGSHKVLAEDLCACYSRQYAVPSTVVRLFSVYGEGLRKQLLWDAMRRFAAGENRFFGTGDEMRDWLHVDDAARLLGCAACEPQVLSTVYNGGCDHATTRTVLASLAELARSGMPPAFSGESHAGNPRRLTADATRARVELGWQPQVALQAGLSRYARWFEASGGL